MSLTATSARSARIPIEHGEIDADIVVPRNPVGLVIFCHGSGSDRRSPRNRRVAGVLHTYRLATMLVDLLTPDEHRIDQESASLRFDIPLLTRRVYAAVEWSRRDPELQAMPLGLFGASTGAAAALAVAALDPENVSAVVSRGGRPDLAGEMLERVQAPTLLVVGSLDWQVLGLNEDARRRIRCECALSVVPGAGHLFEERGTLDRAADLAADWFVRHLTASEVPRSEIESRRAPAAGRATPATGPYRDRSEAGRALAAAVESVASDLVDPVVVALPRGGVPVALPVSRAIDAPLDIVVVRKVGVPDQPERAIGAVGEDGTVLVDQPLARRLAIPAVELREIVDAELGVARRRARSLRGGDPLVRVFDGHDVIVVDDGMATGLTARVAARMVRQRGARRVVLAVPVGPRSVLTDHPDFDAVVCPYTPHPFRAVGLHYRHFDQVPESYVRALLAHQRLTAHREAEDQASRERTSRTE